MKEIKIRSFWYSFELLSSFRSFLFFGFGILLLFCLLFFALSWLLLLQLRFVFIGLGAIIHFEESILLELIQLFLVSVLIDLVLIIVYFLFISLKVIPNLTTFFHCLWMGAILLLLDLVDIRGGIEEIS